MSYPWYSEHEAIVIAVFSAISVAILVLVVALFVRWRKREHRDGFYKRGSINVPVELWNDFSPILSILSDYTDSHKVDQPDQLFRSKVFADLPMDAMWVVYEITDETWNSYLDSEIERINRSAPKGLEIIVTEGMGSFDR